MDEGDKMDNMDEIGRGEWRLDIEGFIIKGKRGRKRSLKKRKKQR